VLTQKGWRSEYCGHLFGPGCPLFSSFFAAECLVEQEQRISTPAAALSCYYAWSGFHFKIRIETSRPSLPFGTCWATRYTRYQSFRQLTSSNGCNSTCSLWQVPLYHAQAECGCGPATTVATKTGQQLSGGRSSRSASSSVTLTAPTAFPIAIQFAFVRIRQATSSSDTQGPTAAPL
jgi:hypothetical protein